MVERQLEPNGLIRAQKGDHLVLKIDDNGIRYEAKVIVIERVAKGCTIKIQQITVGKKTASFFDGKVMVVNWSNLYLEVN